VVSGYELFHHEPLARATGLDPRVIDVALDPEARGQSSLPSEWQNLLTLVDALDDGAHLSDELWDRARTMLTIDQLVALNAVVGYWRTNARLAIACELESEPWMHPDANNLKVRPDAPRPILTPGSVETVGGVVVPALASLGDRGRSWLEQGDARIEPLARLWSWVEDLQVANHRWWDCLVGESLGLSRPLRGQVARTACGSVRNTVLAAVVHELFPESVDDDDPEVAAFIEVWDTARPLSAETGDRLVERLGRRGIVEVQLVNGFIGTQARLLNLMAGHER